MSHTCQGYALRSFSINFGYAAVHIRIDSGRFAGVRNGLPGISGEILCKGHIKRDLQPNQSQKYFGLFFQLCRSASTSKIELRNCRTEYI